MKKVIVNNLVLVSFVMQFFMLACSTQDSSTISNSIAINDNQELNAPTDKQKESKDQLGRNIFDIFEDSQGTLWIGTGENGVARWDGKALTYLTEEGGLCGKTVANITESENGLLWFGTYEDVCRYDLNTAKNSTASDFITYDKDEDGVPYLGYGWKRVKTYADGSFWLNSHHGIYEYKNSEFVEFKVPGEVNSEGGFCNTPGSISMDFIDSKGNLWFGTDFNGAYKYDGKTFTHFTAEEGLISNSITSIEEDRKGNIWFGCRNAINSNNKKEGGVCSYDGHTFTTYQDLDGLHDNNVHTMYSDKKDNLWIGATGVGVYKYDGKTFKLYKEPKEVDYTDNFNISGLQSMLEDSNGRIWMGFSGGLFRLEGETIINVKENGPWVKGC